MRNAAPAVAAFAAANLALAAVSAAAQTSNQLLASATLQHAPEADGESVAFEVA